MSGLPRGWKNWKKKRGGPASMRRGSAAVAEHVRGGREECGVMLRARIKVHIERKKKKRC